VAVAVNSLINPEILKPARYLDNELGAGIDACWETLDKAYGACERAIETDEATAIDWIDLQLTDLGVSLK
jgi:hypothetical protein